MPLNCVEETILWKFLNTNFKNSEHEKVANILAANICTICEEACNRMKAMPAQHPQYTLHDATHILRVNELMHKIIPPETFSKLNPIEIALLILTAHFHDQGMILDKDEFDSLENDTSFKVFKENWLINYPNLKETQEKLKERSISETEKLRCISIVNDLSNAMVSEFVRQNHGKRSAEFIIKRYGNDKRFEACNINITGLLAKLCQSHTVPAYSLSPENGFNYDESVGTYQGVEESSFHLNF